MILNYFVLFNQSLLSLIIKTYIEWCFRNDINIEKKKKKIYFNIENWNLTIEIFEKMMKKIEFLLIYEKYDLICYIWNNFINMFSSNFFMIRKSFRKRTNSFYFVEIKLFVNID